MMAQGNKEINNNFENLEWLIGTWDLANAKPGTNNTESWSRISDSELSGYGVTVRGGDTIMIEKMKIMQKNHKMFYVADIKENKEPVFFELVEITENEFVCENPQHDFPKMIVYKKIDNMLKATISGNGKFIDYLFVKRK